MDGGEGSKWMEIFLYRYICVCIYIILYFLKFKNKSSMNPAASTRHRQRSVLVVACQALLFFPSWVKNTGVQFQHSCNLINQIRLTKIDILEVGLQLSGNSACPACTKTWVCLILNTTQAWQEAYTPPPSTLE